ncbi:predicted protein [Streptomyces sp. SPB78]|nr:predicted protein [Streptomyces sp. SPB78]
MNPRRHLDDVLVPQPCRHCPPFRAGDSPSRRPCPGVVAADA